MRIISVRVIKALKQISIPLRKSKMSTSPTSSTTPIPTRFLIISDTHHFQFGEAERVGGSFTQPTPKCDVLIHCGDLTMTGELTKYEKCLNMLGSIEAELKLVIAGNHDLTLDGKYWEEHMGDRQGYCEMKLGDHEKAVEMWKGPAAKDAGVTYLDEGLYSFTLKSGAKFTVYASPYQPEFYDWAFPYERDEDRFNPPDKVTPGCKSIVENPVPDFPGVDIMMTHGPPAGILDETESGDHAGCVSLLRAASRARPLLYCFGHIHEGYGAQVVEWEERKEGKEVLGIDAIKGRRDFEENAYPEPLRLVTERGRETLMVNAAIKNLRYRPTNSPWLVDLELPRGDSSSTTAML
ncbi:ser/Thr protein phosphatase family protein [Halenospora varia]|nr:ser/Thr protein phosphatase family protein [Halenospora varia]